MEKSPCWYKRSAYDILINCEVATYGIDRYRNENRLSDMYYKCKSHHKPDEYIVMDVNEYFRIPMQKYTIYSTIFFIKICARELVAPPLSMASLKMQYKQWVWFCMCCIIISMIQWVLNIYLVFSWTSIIRFITWTLDLKW